MQAYAAQQYTMHQYAHQLSRPKQQQQQLSLQQRTGLRDAGHKALCPASLLGTLGVGLGTLDVTGHIRRETGHTLCGCCTLGYLNSCAV